jgi:hypothetical protein
LKSDGLKNDGLKNDGLKNDGLKNDGLKSDELKSDELKCDDWTVEIPISEIGRKLASTSKRRGKGEKERKKTKDSFLLTLKNDCER